MDYSYRKLTRTDLEQYRSIRLESLKAYPQCFGASFEEQSKLDKLYFETYIEQDSQDEFVVGAFRDEELVGICALSCSKAQRPDSAELLQMYVRPSEQGNGVGFDIVRTVLEYAPSNDELGAITLQVKADNQAAIRLYGKLGFKSLKNDSATGDMLLMGIKL